MNKALIIIFVTLIFLSVLVVVFPPAVFYSSFAEGKNNSIQLILFSLVLAIIIVFLKIFYKREYEKAEKISYTPHTKYGWYALIFFVAFMFLFYAYAFLSK